MTDATTDATAEATTDATPATSTMFDIRSVAGRLRLVALAEALSWVGLLAGMYFKYLGEPRTEIGVKIFGPIHGGIFIAFAVTAALAAIGYRWSLRTCLLAVLAGVLPLASVIFIIWADRTGKLDASARPPLSSRPAGFDSAKP